MNAEKFRQEILRYVESMRCPGNGRWAYKYAASQEQPVLYASCYAALARYLFDDLDELTAAQRSAWAEHIKAYQDEDGFFRDRIIAHEGSWYVPPHLDWCGWWHLTAHALPALTALGGVAEKTFSVLDSFYDDDYFRNWLDGRDFNRIDYVGNEILTLGSLLQYARDFQDVRSAASAVELLLDWLDRTQDPETGLWGLRFDTPERMKVAYQGAYHFFLLHAYDGREIQYTDRIVDSMLSMQTEQGGFGIRKNTNGCDDIDAVDPLARMYFRTDHRRQDVQAALNRAVDWVLENRTADGSFSFKKDSATFYGSRLLRSEENEGSIMTAWWRSLSLAFACRVLTDHPLAGIHWRFLDCPGCQVWKR